MTLPEVLSVKVLNAVEFKVLVIRIVVSLGYAKQVLVNLSPGQIYNVGCSPSVTIEELVEDPGPVN